MTRQAHLVPISRVLEFEEFFATLADTLAIDNYSTPALVFEHSQTIVKWIDAVRAPAFYLYDLSLDEVNLFRFLPVGEVNQASPTEYFSNLEQRDVRRYMSVCSSSMVWHWDHLASELQRGVLQAAFARLGELHRREAGLYDEQ